jgi:putative ABC transport system ATP-binding protein
VLFADEPTGNLDSHSGAEVLELLGEAASEYGQTIVMVTHDSSAAAAADRVIQLVDGRVDSDVEVAA